MANALDTSQDLGELFFRELADNAPVMIWRSGPDALCDWFNKPWLDFVGRAMQQEIGNGWAEGVHPDDFDRCLQIYLQAFEARKSFSMVYRLRRHDGAYRQILDNGAPFQRRGEFAGYFGSCIDVTEREELEAQLRQAQKMEAVGQLTGGIAHDFNNLLQVIGGNLQLLEKGLPRDERVQRRMQNAQEAVRRGSTLASQLLSFARRQALAPKVLNLGRLVCGMDDMLRRTLSEAVEIETVIACGLWNAHVDPTQLETAILNLAVNARDAMAGRGRLTIEAGNTLLDDAYAAQHAEVDPGQYVMVAVTDTGCGMPKEVAEKVFDPFFTTKPEGQGTGLGLSMVHGFVKQSGGHIKVYSEVGQGTTIRIYLPRSRQKEDAPVDVATRAITGGGEVVLVVEDDDDVRATTCEMLIDLGYRVLRARDADKGMAIIDSGAVIDLLFADVVMPGQLNSRDLGRKAHQKLPGLPILFTSGYADYAIGHAGRADHGFELLAKPFTREELAQKLRLLLDRTSTACPTNSSRLGTIEPRWPTIPAAGTSGGPPLGHRR